MAKTKTPPPPARFTHPIPGSFHARTMTFDSAGLDLEKRTVPMSISSDTDQILRWVPGIGNDGYGAMAWEVLEHTPESVNLERFAEPEGGPLLLEHSRDATHGPAAVGRYHITAIAGGKTQGIAQFGTHDRAEQAWRAILDKSLVHTSVYYDYDPKDVEVTGFRDGFPVATVHRWTPSEGSLVAVPADITTGVMRAFGSEATAPLGAMALGTADTPAQPGFEASSPVAPGGVVNPGGEDPSQEPDPEGESLRSADDDDLCHQDPDCTDEDCWERQEEDGSWTQHLCERCASGRDALCEDPDCFRDHLCSRCACGRSNDPDYNLKKYGDVEFGDEQNKKYPLDKKHIKAAWSYINKKKDAAKYSKAKLKIVRDRIIAAYKKAFGEDPPEIQNEDDRGAAQHPAGARAVAPAAAAGARSTPPPAASGRPLIEGGSPMEPNAQAGTPAAASASPNVADALQIRALAAQLGHAAKADELLRTLPLEQAREAILAHLTANPTHRVASLENLGASPAEANQFNLGRALLALVDHPSGKRVNCFELEVSDQLKKQQPMSYKDRGGIMLPYAVRSARARSDTPLNTYTATAGAEAIFVEPGQTIDVLRNLLVTARLGASVFTGLDSPLGLPRQDTDVTAAWVNEDTGTATESEFATSLVTLTPHTLMGTTAVTRQLLELAVKSFEIQGRLMNSLAYASQKAIDAAALFGSGSAPQPQGIWTAASVNAVDFNSAAAGTGAVPAAPYAWKDVIGMVAKVVASNVPLVKPAFVTNASLAAVFMSTLKFLVSGLGAGAEIWQGGILEGQMAGFPALSSQQVLNVLTPTAITGGVQTGLIFGSWEELLIGLFGNGFEVIVDPYTQKKSGIIEITSFNMADVKLAHPQAFCIGTDIILSGSAQTQA
jgi:HK97 family phage major capsid protein